MPLTDIFPEEVQLWNKIQNECNIAFDIGVNDICHLCHYRYPDNNVKVWMFEPNPANAKVMQDQYGSMDNVKIFNFGFGEEARDIVIHNKTMSIFDRHMYTDDTTYTASIVRLDDFCGNSDVAELDFLKIDTEGYDGRILLSGKNIIQTCKWIQIENFFIMETDPVIKQRVIDMIIEMGLHVYRMLSGFHKVDPKDMGSYPDYCNYLLSKEEFSNGI